MENKLLGSKLFLYVTEFFAGVSVMAVELGASRLMAPYFSSSQIVWTVIIGVIMIAMAIGNLWGGKLADKTNSPDKLYGRILIAAIWIALIPFVGRWLIAGVSLLLAMFVTKNFLVWAALAACLVIFAGVLAAIGIVYFAFARKKMLKGIVAAVVIVGLCFTLPTYSFAFWENDIALEDESIYNYLQVKDSDRQTTLSTNVLFGVQSIQRKDTELTGMYYDYALAAPCMAGMNGSDNDSRAVMILGMGSGTYASYCVRYFPGVTVQGAEIDKKIADIATEYFGLPDSVEVAVEDGRAYLTASEKQFDVIMVDAYQDITIPFQLSSVEFFTEVQRHLKPGGVMVVNLNMTSAQDGSINQYLCDTMSSVFAHTYTVNVPANTNTVVFCSDSDDLRQTFDENRVLLQNTSYAAMMETVARDLRDYTGGDHILTDDKAPVELLGMRVLDELIDGQLSYYKEQFSMEEIINMVT